MRHALYIQYIHSNISLIKLNFLDEAPCSYVRYDVLRPQRYANGLFTQFSCGCVNNSQWFLRFFTHVMQCGSTCIKAIVWVSHYRWSTVYTKKYAHGFVVLCFVVAMQSFIINSHEVFIHIQQGCFAGTGAIVRLPQCQWSKPDGYGKIRQCITTTKHSKAVTVCIFLGTYCIIKSLRLSDEYMPL